MSKSAQFSDLRSNPPEGIGVGLKNFNINTWSAFIFGPKDSPYYGGQFIIDIDFPENYPTNPPVLKMITPIYHPNINDYGTICIDIIRDNWNPNITIKSILLSVVGILKYPNENSPWPSKKSIADQIKNDYRGYFKKAQELTLEHAM